MQLPHTIDLQLFDMTEQTNIEQVVYRIELHSTYLHWEMELLADEPHVNEDGETDKNMPWNRTKTYLNATILRERLSGIDMTYIKGSKIWKVTIIVPAAEPRFYFKTRTKAEAFKETLTQYIIPEYVSRGTLKGIV